MSDRIYTPPRRRRQLPLGEYEPERMLAILVLAVIVASFAGFLIWAVRSH